MVSGVNAHAQAEPLDLITAALDMLVQVAGRVIFGRESGDQGALESTASHQTLVSTLELLPAHHCDRIFRDPASLTSG